MGAFNLSFGLLLDLVECLANAVNFGLGSIFIALVDWDPTNVILILNSVTDVIFEATFLHLPLLVQAVKIENVIPEEMVFFNVDSELLVVLFDLNY